MIWKRFGRWCAHLFDGEQQMCPTRHGKYLRGFDLAAKPMPGPSVVAELTPHGVPYGRVCARCLRVFEAFMSAAPDFQPRERYDLSCAYCVDGGPVGRFRGKATCECCARAFGEAGFALDRGPSVRRAPSRAYIVPLYERALLKRGALRR